LDVWKLFWIQLPCLAHQADAVVRHRDIIGRRELVALLEPLEETLSHRRVRPVGSHDDVSIKGGSIRAFYTSAIVPVYDCEDTFAKMNLLLGYPLVEHVIEHGPRNDVPIGASPISIINKKRKEPGSQNTNLNERLGYISFRG